MEDHWSDLYDIWAKEKGGGNLYWTSLPYREQAAWEAVLEKTSEGDRSLELDYEFLEEKVDCLQEKAIEVSKVFTNYKLNQNEENLDDLHEVINELCRL